jgi:hypothetical protein
MDMATPNTNSLICSYLLVHYDGPLQAMYRNCNLGLACKSIKDMILMFLGP